MHSLILLIALPCAPPQAPPARCCPPQAPPARRVALAQVMLPPCGTPCPTGCGCELTGRRDCAQPIRLPMPKSVRARSLCGCEQCPRGGCLFLSKDERTASCICGCGYTVALRIRPAPVPSAVWRPVPLAPAAFYPPPSYFGGFGGGMPMMGGFGGGCSGGG